MLRDEKDEEEPAKKIKKVEVSWKFNERVIIILLIDQVRQGLRSAHWS